MKAWSISTTIRNPERIPDFLKAVEPVVGTLWSDKKSQVLYFAQTIATRAYEPLTSRLSPEMSRIRLNEDETISLEQAFQMIQETNYVGGADLRGRTSMSVLVDNGLVETFDKVKITPLGKALLADQITFSEVMLNFSLKFQVPQPSHSKYKSEDGYAIRPFVGILALIKKVNQLWESEDNDRKGLSWDEFCIFGPTLIHFDSIDTYANEIVSIRNAVEKAKGNAEKSRTFENRRNRFLAELLERKESLTKPKTVKNLYDYGDNSFRYFKQSKFLSLRGGGRYIDISPLSEVQVDMLLTDEEYKPLHFGTNRDYSKYLSDLTSFVPPWATPENTHKIEVKLQEILKEKGAGKLPAPKIKAQASLPTLLRESETILNLREAITDLNIQDMSAAATTVEFLEACIEDYTKLGRRQDIDEAAVTRIKTPTQLEYVTFKTFLAINDLIQIKPNYPVDDDGNPVFTAGANVPDLEVFYKDFNIVCEVTMMTNRSQWMAESQPVQRHLADFLLRHNDKEAIGVFIAPAVHRDTKNSFRQAFHTGFDSLESLKIVPFDFNVWGEIIRLLADKRRHGKNMSQENLHDYLESLLPSTQKSETTDDWWNRISEPSNILEYI